MQADQTLEKTSVAKGANKLNTYEELLEDFNLVYKHVGYYLQVGEITKTQGWILHISCVLCQISNLLQVVVPYLAKSGTAFKIVPDEPTGEDMLSGNFGLSQIGKIVTLYPNDDEIALQLAKSLLSLTKMFKGPAIPTDVCLGGVIYTRYGSFNPIVKPDAEGKMQKYIYNSAGDLIEDYCPVPFHLTHQIKWPFHELADPSPKSISALINKIYKITDILKSDPRGNVFKGLYVKGLFRVKPCVLKQGFTNSNSDRHGRDIEDRLIWQAELYGKLHDIVPMPRIYETLREQGFTLLIMEYINGKTLYESAQDINPKLESWPMLSVETRLTLLNFGKEICQIVEKLHRRGYIHRDIVPVNFLLNKKQNLLLIDMELAYSTKEKKPDPAFSLGTSGFMSPEQQAQSLPDESQDIYALGATLLLLFTGLTPTRFNSEYQAKLSQSLDFFLNDETLASTISACLNRDPQTRPSISNILHGISHHQEDLSKAKNNISKVATRPLNKAKLQEVIFSSLKGLLKLPDTFSQGLWYSKNVTPENFTSPKIKQYTILPGLGEGICGPLYMLAKLRTAGIEMDACSETFKFAWEFVAKSYLSNVDNLTPSLYNGSGGIALALITAIKCGMLNNSELNLKFLTQCLNIKPDRLNIAYGVAGHAILLLTYNRTSNMPDSKIQLSNAINQLLSSQQKDGSWIRQLNSNKNNSLVSSFPHDDLGIIWLLLEYNSIYRDKTVTSAINKSLQNVTGNKTNMTKYYNAIGTRTGFELEDGGKGLILVLIKAYEVLKDNYYKRLAEEALFKISPRVVQTNFSQYNGMAGLGEVYLEAWKVFSSEEWKSRADWIALFFMHTFYAASDTAGYWIMEENNPPTADFLTGITGIIHFLARCLEPDNIGYPILT